MTYNSKLNSSKNKKNRNHQQNYYIIKYCIYIHIYPHIFLHVYMFYMLTMFIKYNMSKCKNIGNILYSLYGKRKKNVCVCIS